MAYKGIIRFFRYYGVNSGGGVFGDFSAYAIPRIQILRRKFGRDASDLYLKSPVYLQKVVTEYNINIRHVRRYETLLKVVLFSDLSDVLEFFKRCK